MTVDERWGLWPADIRDHPGKWVAVAWQEQPPRVIAVADDEDGAAAAGARHGVEYLVIRVPQPDEPELVGLG